jgi:hypothetical protein
MLMFWASVGCYGLGFLVTLLHLLLTGRAGLKPRARQLAAAIAWPAYWMLVHGVRGTLRCAAGWARGAARLLIPRPVRRIVWLVLSSPARGVKLLAKWYRRAVLYLLLQRHTGLSVKTKVRSAKAAVRSLVQRSARALGAAAMLAARSVVAAGARLWKAWKQSLPGRYVKNYEHCRRAGLSRRATVWFAWLLMRAGRSTS